MRKNKALALALAAAMTASMTPITAMADETEGLTSYYTYQTAVNDYSKIYSLYGIVSGYRYLTYSHG